MLGTTIRSAAIRLTSACSRRPSAAADTGRSAHGGSDQPLMGSRRQRRVSTCATSIHATTFSAVLILLQALAVLVVPLAAEAQEAGKVARVGVLRPSSPPDLFLESFKQGLRELGYVEGRN